jgi:CO dehydrogenase/acetyl-CoA synthase beta subunit
MQYPMAEGKKDQGRVTTAFKEEEEEEEEEKEERRCSTNMHVDGIGIPLFADRQTRSYFAIKFQT